MVNRITKGEPGPLPVFDDALRRDCHAVLLPVVGGLEIPDWLGRLLEGGLGSVLLGETREEYVTRGMSEHRRETETADDIRGFIESVDAIALGDLLVAVDQEPWGIRRLHGLVPSYLDPDSFLSEHLPEFRQNARTVAEAAKDLGVSMFLAPVVDVLSGENVWLEGRTLHAPAPHAIVGSVAAAYVGGTQDGGVATVVKHFPGFPCVTADPAVDRTARVPAGSWDDRSLQPFIQAVRAGAAGVMLGPAVVEDVDRVQPASTSQVTVETLRHTVGFSGVVVSDDLDAPATLNGRSLTTTMIDSLRAGADLLLVAGGDHLHESIETVFQTARNDDDFAIRVRAAAGRVRGTARTFA
jgi:beta-N-acetylhexosaminidase